MLDLSFNKDSLSEFSFQDCLIYVLSNSKLSLDKLKESFQFTNAEFKIIDLEDIPKINSVRDILLVDKKYYFEIDPDTIERILSERFYLYSFSEGPVLGDPKNLNKFLSGHLVLPFKNIDIKNMIHISNMKNTYNTKMSNMEKVSSLGNYTGSLIHDLNNYNSICMFSLDAIRLINDDKYHDKKLSLFAEKGLKGTMFLKELCAKYHYLLKGESHYKKEEFSINTIINNATETMDHLLKSYNIPLRGLAKKEERFIVIGDALVFTQVLVNIIKNAIEAINKSEEKWIKINLKVIQDELFLVIVDSGQGILDKDQAAILKGDVSSKEKGTGFGLSFCDLELQKMGMKLVYLEAKNTSFGIKIPKKYYKIDC